MSQTNPSFATLQEFAAADVLVTTKEYLRGEPTIPLAHALHTADDQAEHAPDNEQYGD